MWLSNQLHACIGVAALHHTLKHMSNQGLNCFGSRICPSTSPPRMQESQSACSLQLEPYGGRDVPANVSCESVTLDSPLRPGKSTVLETYSALAHQLAPRPKEILQSENQRVLLTAPQHTISPYPVTSETTEARPDMLVTQSCPRFSNSTDMKSVNSAMTGYTPPASEACLTSLQVSGHIIIHALCSCR